MTDSPDSLPVPEPYDGANPIEAIIGRDDSPAPTPPDDPLGELAALLAAIPPNPATAIAASAGRVAYVQFAEGCFRLLPAIVQMVGELREQLAGVKRFELQHNILFERCNRLYCELLLQIPQWDEMSETEKVRWTVKTIAEKIAALESQLAEARLDAFDEVLAYLHEKEKHHGRISEQHSGQIKDAHEQCVVAVQACILGVIELARKE